ncbi:hypothetical protein VTO42DRAFT_1522 [Malbranchea cinnamomea]
MYVDPSDNVQAARTKLLAEKAPEALISRHAANVGTILALHSSTELMQNYVQGEIVSPTGKFEALQTSDGLALLFAIGTLGVFHVIEERSGSFSTGWQVRNLSTVIIKDKFPTSSDAVVSTFDVGQNALNGDINLAMSVRPGGSDHLFISLKNYSAGRPWTKNLNWRYIQFDAVGERPESITITRVLFAETVSGGQYLVVDILRLSGGTEKDIVRYYVNPTRSTGRYWKKHDVPIDIRAGRYQSCVGRVFNGYVDGIYTAGTDGGVAQFIYEPVVNVLGDGPPAPLRLALPERISIVYVHRSLRHKRFHAIPLCKQGGGRPPQTLIANEFLSETDTLLAMAPLPASWSAPVPILTGIERISAFVNRVDGGNTIFASGNGKLEEIIQATSAADRVWRAVPITLAAPPHEKPLSFKSYTTTIHVTDEQNLPVKDVPVAISANTRAPVYINGLYYILGETAVKVPTNATGSVTVIEATEDINAAILTVSIDGAAVSRSINPMDNSFAKLTALNSTEKLRNASFPSETRAGGVIGTPRSTPLVDPSTDSRDLKRCMALYRKDRVYGAILDTVDAIVGALDRAFKTVKTDIIRFVEFLFEWDYIRRTKDVIHNVVKLWLQGLAAQSQPRKPPSDPVTISGFLGNCIYKSCHSIAGFLIFNGNFLNIFEAEALTGDNPFSIPSAIIGIVTAASAGAGDAFVPTQSTIGPSASYPRSPRQQSSSPRSFSAAACKRSSRRREAGLLRWQQNDGRATGAVVNSILVVPALFVTGWHFYATRSAAIVNEVANLTSYVSRVAYAVAVNDEEPESRQMPNRYYGCE